MTLRDDLLPVLDQARAIMDGLGWRLFTVAVVVTEYQGPGLRGSYGPRTTVIRNANGSNPKVRDLISSEIALGNYSAGTIEVGPITPDYSGGGTALSILCPDVEDGSQVYYLVTGPGYPECGARFDRKDFSADKALRYMMTLERVADGADD